MRAVSRPTKRLKQLDWELPQLALWLSYPSIRETPPDLIQALTPGSFQISVLKVFWSINHQMISILKATASFGELLQITSRIKSKSLLQLFPRLITDIAGLLGSTRMSNIIHLIFSTKKLKVALLLTLTVKWLLWSTTLIRWASSLEVTKFYCLSAVITPSLRLRLILDKWIKLFNISTQTMPTTSISNTQPHPTLLIP